MILLQCPYKNTLINKLQHILGQKSLPHISTPNVIAGLIEGWRKQLVLDSLRNKKRDISRI